MTDRRAHNSTLRTSTKRLKRTPIARHTPLRHGSGTSFKLTPDDKALWKWLGELTKDQRLPCDGCGRFKFLSRSHLMPKSRGGRVIDNIALLCEDELRYVFNTILWRHRWKAFEGCHTLQEKDTDQFNAEMGVELYAKARGHTAQWRKETGRGREIF